MSDEQQRAREELIQKIQVGEDEIERGEGIEIDECSLERFFADIDAEVRRELDETGRESE